MHEMHGVMTLN